MNFQYSNKILFFQIPVTYTSNNSTLPEEKSAQHLGWEVDTANTSNNLEGWDSNPEEETALQQQTDCSADFNAEVTIKKTIFQ